MVKRLLTAVCAVVLLGSGSARAADAPLAIAAERGDAATVRRLIGQRVDVNAPSVDGATALHRAAYGDQPEIVGLLLAAGADASRADRYGVTPLSLACLNGNATTIRLLLDAGADPNAVDPSGDTVLMIAARTGLTPAIGLLLDRGARVDTRDQEYGQTALMLAVREGQPAAVSLLIERGADVNVQTRKGTAPAFVPPCKGTGCGSEGVGINRGGLPDRGRRGEARGGMTPLLYAARDGQLDAARRLLGPEI